MSIWHVLHYDIDITFSKEAGINIAI